MPTAPRPRLESQDPSFAKGLFTGAGPAYDRLSDGLSFWQYGRWEDRLVGAAMLHGIGPKSQVLDVATGTGRIAAALRRRTGCTTTGLDLTRDMLRRAQARPAEAGARRLLQGTADALPFPDASFDGLTFSYLYRYVPDPAATTRELLRVVRPGGFVGFVEFHRPPHPVAYRLWQAHTRINLPLFGALGGRQWVEIGRFLGPNIESFYKEWDVGRLRAMWQGSGVQAIQHEVMSLGGGLVMWGRKEGED